MWQAPSYVFVKRSSVTSNYPKKKWDDENESQGEDEADQPIENDSSLYNNSLRTQLLLLDYKQFKAARTIQKTFRGWNVRKSIKKQHQAATTIQKIWSVYMAMRRREIVAQEMAQEAILTLFESSSIKIQAIYRGWWSRKYVNNSIRHRNIQLDILEDILTYLAQKLHSTIRAGKLPGFFSFSDDECLTKVANLVATMSYRMSNFIVDQKFRLSRVHAHKYQTQFRKAWAYTWAPFEGTDCESQSDWAIDFKYYDHAEQTISERFVNARRLFERNQVRATTPVVKPPKELSQKQKDFCEQMLYTVKKYSVIREQNLHKSESFMDLPVAEFLDTIKGYLESFNYLDNCYCHSDLTNSPRFS